MGALADLWRYTTERLRPPKEQTVSEWADENRVLTSETSAEPGRWRTDRAPYQREIMDAFTQRGVWQIVIMASAQVGKSEIELNMLGYVIDNDPGPILYVQPTKDTAEEYSKRRIAPLISNCPTLREKVNKPRSRDDTNTLTMKTFPGGSVAIVGANSPADLASKPVRFLFCDETDRYPASAGTEGNPIELAERRTETFRHNRKEVLTSTPTIKGHSKIEKAYMNGTQEEWHTQCPHCQKYSYIRFNDIRFENTKFTNKDGEEDFVVKNVVWCCPRCKGEVKEYACKRLPAKWEAQNPEAIQNGIRSFRLNAFMSPWSDWKDIIRKFLKAGKDPEELKIWYNTMLGESWEIRDGNGLEEKLYKRREYYSAEVPEGVLVLTMGVDTQDNRLEYEVVGWDRNGQSWGISRGVIPGRPDQPDVWNELDGLLDRTWHHAAGIGMKIMLTFIDSGGHYTQQVYDECDRRRGRKVFAIKGESGENTLECRLMKKDASKSARFILGVDPGKGGVMYEASIDQPGPHYMHFPQDFRAGYDREYFKGLISEKMVVHQSRGKSVMVWEKIEGHERNEALDCRVYARCAYRSKKWDFDKYERAVKGESEPTAIVTRKEETQRKSRRVISQGIRV